MWSGATLSKLCGPLPPSLALGPLGAVGCQGRGGGCFDRPRHRRSLSDLSSIRSFWFWQRGPSEGEAAPRAHKVELSTIDLSRKFVMVLLPRLRPPSLIE